MGDEARGNEQQGSLGFQGGMHRRVLTDSDSNEEEDEGDYQDSQTGEVSPEARAVSNLVGVAILQQALLVGRRLNCDPLAVVNNAGPQPNPQLQMMAAARQDLRVKFQSFSGKSKEDPDCHVSQFQRRWQARGFDGVYDAQAKMRNNLKQLWKGRQCSG